MNEIQKIIEDGEKEFDKKFGFGVLKIELPNGNIVQGTYQTLIKAHIYKFQKKIINKYEKQKLKT